MLHKSLNTVVIFQTTNTNCCIIILTFLQHSQQIIVPYTQILGKINFSYKCLRNILLHLILCLVICFVNAILVYTRNPQAVSKLGPHKLSWKFLATCLIEVKENVLFYCVRNMLGNLHNMTNILCHVTTIAFSCKSML